MTERGRENFGMPRPAPHLEERLGWIELASPSGAVSTSQRNGLEFQSGRRALRNMTRNMVGSCRFCSSPPLCCGRRKHDALPGLPLTTP
jgi:hypothetical protein